jgi:O-antigen/teichoic acid export membrane protein
MSLRDYIQSDKPLARVLNNLAWLMAGKGFGAALSLFYLALATQLLGPEQFGYFTLILGTAQAISAIVSFQSWQLVIRFGSHNLAGDSSAALRKNNALTAFCIWIDLGAALVGLVLVVAVILIFAHRFAWADNFTLSALVFSAVMLLSIKSSAIGVLRLYDRFRDGALAAAVTPLMRLIGALAAWIFAPNVAGFLAAWALAEIATTIAHFLLVRIKTPVRPTQASWRDIKAVPASHDRFYKFALVTNAGATLKSVAQQVPLLVVGFVVGPAAAGFFRLAYQLKDAAARFAEMLSRSVYAEFSSLHARGDIGESQVLFRQLRRVAAIGALLLAVIAAFAGRPILLMVAGPAFLPAYPILLILSAASAIELFGVGYEPHLMAIGKPHISLIIRAISVILLIVMMVILLPPFGSQGAAYAILTYSAVAVALFHFYDLRTNARHQQP